MWMWIILQSLSFTFDEDNQMLHLSESITHFSHTTWLPQLESDTLQAAGLQ